MASVAKSNLALRPITHDQKDDYNRVVTHPLQSFEWGEFREKTGVKVIRRGFFDGDKLVDGFTFTLHPIPHTKWNVGYLPKGKMPTKESLGELQRIGKEHNCIFIQLEPNIINRHMENDQWIMDNEEKIDNGKWKIVRAAHPLFTKYTFILTIDKSEEELLKEMHSKTRYNIRVATKHGVFVKEDNSEQAFQNYLRLTEETTKRQGFYAHSRKYHETQWQTFSHKTENHLNDLTSHLLTGSFDGKVLTTLLFFVFHDTLYYPYGASSNELRNTMHSTLTMWEGIKLGKKLGLKRFDMWGAAEEAEPTPQNPYYGFHRFKMGFGASYTEFLGSYDLIINPQLYQLYKISDKVRWSLLHMKSKLFRNS